MPRVCHRIRRRAPLSVGTVLEDTGYNPGFGLDESFEDYVELMQE